MTECERLIENGTFSHDFFKEEVRCDFLVTTERKKIWAIELDLILQLDRVCAKHNLRYYLIEGSLLGAVRHHGIIPWDDDMDVIMPRKDYETLKTLKYEFSHPYFLQFPGDDNGYFFSFAKIRNSLTTAIGIPFRYEKFNQGIGVDIFVLDSVNMNRGEDEYSKIATLIRQNSAYMRRSNPHPTVEDIKRILEAGHVNPITNLKDIDYIAQSHNDEDCDHVGLVTSTAYPFRRHVWRKEDFSFSSEMMVEGFRFHVPGGWDAILRTTYGEYMTFPPVEKRGSWHGTTKFHPDKPYTEFTMLNM